MLLCNKQSMAQSIFIRLADVARKIGCHRATLGRALKGEINSPHLVAKYLEIAGPAVARNAELLGAHLPAGVEIYLKDIAAAKLLTAQLGANATRSRRTVRLLKPFALIPAAVAGGEQSTSGGETTKIQ